MTLRTGLLQLTVCGAYVVCGTTQALAHKGSDAYLDVQEVQQPSQVAGAQNALSSSSAVAGAGAALREYRFSLAVAVKDLDLLVPMDANADGKVTWGEARAAMPLVLALANEAANVDQRDNTRAQRPSPLTTQSAAREPSAAGITTAAGGTASLITCALRWQSDGFDRRSDGSYVRLAAMARCDAGQPLAFRYTLLKDQDANHRLLVAGHIGGRELLTTTSPSSPNLVFQAGAAVSSSGAAADGATAGAAQQPSSAWAALRDYFLLGMHHLLEGYDHLAFLLALVLPLRLILLRAAPVLVSAPALAVAAAPVFRVSETGRAPLAERAPAGVWLALLRTVTAFTIGHSITLMLATFGWTQASPRWVEPVIALSIIVTALLNIRPVPWIRTDVLALLFGLVHGYGFAGLLLEAAAPSGLLPWALAGFNLGVEAGQLIAVCGWVLVAQPLMGKAWYPRLVVRGGSALLVLLAAWWFWQRIA